MANVAIIDGRQSGRTAAILLGTRALLQAGEHVVTTEGREVTLDEVEKAIEMNGVEDFPFSRLSLDPKSPDFHPSYVRVGLRIDGKERNDIQFFDAKTLEYMTTNKTSHLAETIEPYWRFAESRQQRRARERWEGKRK